MLAVLAVSELTAVVLAVLAVQAMDLGKVNKLEAQEFSLVEAVVKLVLPVGLEGREVLASCICDGESMPELAEEWEETFPERMGFAPIELDCILARCKDGDTYVVTANDPNKPFYPFKELVVRLKGCDCPELHDARPMVSKLARDAMTYMQQFVGKPVKVRTVRQDAYGRIEGDVWRQPELVPGTSGTVAWLSVKEDLVLKGLAKIWDGRGKSPWVTITV